MKELTEDADTRFVYLSTIVAGLTALSLPLYVALSASSAVAFDMTAVGANVLTTYLLAATLAYVYALGTDVYNAVKGERSSSDATQSDVQGSDNDRTDGALRTE